MSRAECLVVALTGGAEGRLLLARAAGMVARSPQSRLHSVHVQRRRSGGASDPGLLEELRDLTERLGGTHHTVAADDPARAVLDVARAVEATAIVVGASRRSRLRSAVRAGVGDRIVADAGEVDVLMVAHPFARGSREPTPVHVLGRRRRAVGWVVALLAPALFAALVRGSSSGATWQALVFLSLTVLAALVGGRSPGVVAALLGSLLLNYFFTPPVHSLSVQDTTDRVAIGLLLVVALAVAMVVDQAARRSAQADRARREADALSMLNRALLRSGHGGDALLDLVRETFHMSAASLVQSSDTGWSVLAARGERPPTGPGEADADTEVSPTVRLLLRGQPLPAHRLRVLSAFGTHVAVVLERDRLQRAAAEARLLAEGNRLRTALLAAVSHDLRTPLAGIKAAVTTLRTRELTLEPADQNGLLGTIEESADRLTAIIANLLDMSRLQTGGVTLLLSEVGVEDIVSRAVAGLQEQGRLRIDLPPDLPAVEVDAGLLERVVVNLVDNALRHTRGPVEVRGERVGERVMLSVVDHGPGVPEAAKGHLFEPFQRRDDASARAGVGLGLAVAKGLTEAVGGALRVADTTPGPGLTFTVELGSVTAATEPAVP